MDLEDPRVRWLTPRPPTVECHERKRNDRGGGGRTSSRKTKANNKCPTASATDKGTAEASRKPAQINPLMTVLMSSRQRQLQEQQQQQQYDQPASRTPERLTACRTVNLELPEHYLPHRSTVKRPAAPSQRKLPARKCIVPDEYKLKVCLRW